MDDLKGRREAQNLNLKLTGTLGILVLAKEKESVIPAKKYSINLSNGFPCKSFFDSSSSTKV
jgi:predicted nucleic acid-binding protein